MAKKIIDESAHKQTPSLKARLVKHESNIKRHTEKTQETAKVQQNGSNGSSAKLKGGQEVLKIILRPPSPMFYKDGVQELIFQAMDQCGTKAETAENIGISTGHMYNLTRTDKSRRSNAGKKTIEGLSRLCGVKIAIRKQFYIEHLVPDPDK